MGNQLALPVQFFFSVDNQLLGENVWDLDCFYSNLHCFYCSEEIGIRYITGRKNIMEFVEKTLLKTEKVEVFDTSLDVSVSLACPSSLNSVEVNQQSQNFQKNFKEKDSFYCQTIFKVS